MSNLPEMFGSLVFNDVTMKERLPKATYKALQQTIKNGAPLDLEVADVVANAMKDWAIEKGVTHYTHWFQPMTGVTAEKHDSFISPTGNGQVIMEFSGKELIKGEPDASSFPSGGLRATFEARGYTAWDPTSYAFIKDGILCIPTAFCSYGGEVLDKKTPLLRSMKALSDQAVRVLKLFGVETKSVLSTVGPEQEYFLIDEDVYKKRRDLLFTGRTLFGARAPKGQELEDHYFGSIKPRVSAYMNELDEELWKLGVLAKTKHNEVAPAQHELAPIYTSTNVATDHNQLTMEVMKKVAAHHHMVCLLHEKPFAGVNGSGKHNNWSISTDTGANLLDPGNTPSQNAQFMLFLTAVIKAVDDYQDLLRLTVASAGNDHRLGANEAPPAIVSVFLGDELGGIVDSIISGKPYKGAKETMIQIGVDTLPAIPKDTTDRNRTSPFAFTGNKFEFRMLGSSSSISCPNIFLNTIVAESLRQFADELEKSSKKNFNSAVSELIRRTLTEHQRILFNGNNYSPEWVEEAERRGLLNLKTTADALPYYIAEKNIELFARHKVFTKKEVFSRYEILLDNYCKVINIEALTMLDMAKKDILPAVISYSKELSNTIICKKQVSLDLPTDAEETLLRKISSLTSSLYHKIEALDAALLGAKDYPEGDKCAKYYSTTVLNAMNELRAVADELEVLTAKSYWPFPSYGDMLFSIQ